MRDSILRKRDSFDYRFEIQSKGKVVTAHYTGIVPDTFADDAEVVLKGTLEADGFHVAPNGVHGQVPVEVRSRRRARGGARNLVTAPSLHLAVRGRRSPAACGHERRRQLPE